MSAQGGPDSCDCLYLSVRQLGLLTAIPLPAEALLRSSASLPAHDLIAARVSAVTEAAGTGIVDEAVTALCTAPPQSLLFHTCVLVLAGVADVLAVDWSQSKVSGAETTGTLIRCVVTYVHDGDSSYGSARSTGFVITYVMCLRSEARIMRWGCCNHVVSYHSM
jgi:hypothetical protein